MHTNPSYFAHENYPVENVSWNDVQTFLKKINQFTGKRFRLPTEAEWEYAAGGGATNRTKWSGTSNQRNLVEYAWYDENSGRSFWKSGKPQPVATKKPHCLGLFDMSGNVWEWCQDTYGPYPGCTGDAGVHRVQRGGSYFDGARSCRVACRDYGHPAGRSVSCGFRLAASFQ